MKRSTISAQRHLRRGACVLAALVLMLLFSGEASARSARGMTPGAAGLGETHRGCPAL